MRSFVTALFLCLYACTAQAQLCPHINYKDPWYNPVKDRNMWVEACAGGFDGIFTSNIGGYILPGISLEVGMGSSGMHWFAAYHFPLRSRHFDTYIGPAFGLNTGDETLYEANSSNPLTPTWFFSAGCRYVFNNGISLAIEADPHTSDNLSSAAWGAFKVGYCFHLEE